MDIIALTRVKKKINPQQQKTLFKFFLLFNATMMISDAICFNKDRINVRMIHLSSIFNPRNYSDNI